MGPIIGITTRRREVQSSAGTSPTHTLNDAYTQAVERAGGHALLFVSQDPATAAAMLDRVDGLILSGGGDIHPAAYDGPDHDSVYGLEPNRDAFEFALIREAMARRMPTLAICRGLQVLNVALGGSLHVDIQHDIDGANDHFLTGDPVYETPVTVNLEADSLLAAICGATLAGVNSIHHQSVKELGAGLRSVGTSTDGVIEAVEHEDADWPMLGVQWHPEFLSDKADPFALALFESLISAAAG
ncbi:MAG: gamma-glutamyl-gamma-aminobutyrate hydrolase family protein [Acidimicrobiia bacterium]|nr:gamma-glutamyl-gamma-aminobutyrate hydrolase family protein [Acidimicrobiia bacterium]